MNDLHPLVLTKKTGFRVTDVNVPVVIRDKRGILFYTTEPFVPNCKEFNLPEGEYFIDSGKFVQMEAPVNYPLCVLPPPQRNIPKPFDFQFFFGDNPNKCTILWDRKIIFFDNRLKEKPLYVLFFILYHEYGHALYEKEKWADRMAGNYMKIKGFNESQIKLAPWESLSAQNLERKRYMIAGINNASKRRKR